MTEFENDLLDPNKMPEKLTELDDRSRRNNRRTDSQTENINETSDDYEKKVLEVLRDKYSVRYRIWPMSVYGKTERISSTDNLQICLF